MLFGKYSSPRASHHNSSKVNILVSRSNIAALASLTKQTNDSFRAYGASLGSRVAPLTNIDFERDDSAVQEDKSTVAVPKGCVHSEQDSKVQNGVRGEVVDPGVDRDKQVVPGEDNKVVEAVFVEAGR